MSTYWSRHTEPFPEKDVEYYAKIVARITPANRRLIYTQDGHKELTEEEFRQFLVEAWTGSSREYVWNMIEAFQKK